MGAPLYFLPRVLLSGFASGGKPNRALLESRGLSASLADVQTMHDVAYCEVAGKGPDGNPGLVVSPLPVGNREPPRRLGYYPADGQEWLQVGPDLWATIDAAFPPTPADMARKTRHAGVPVVLGDGQAWEVPTLRRPETGQPTLPQDMHWDAAGNFTVALRREYEALWRKTERVARLFFDPEAADYQRIDLQEALGIALDALALNYRIGPVEQRLLHLVTSANWEECLGAMVDVPFVSARLRAEEEAEKKSADRAGPEADTSAVPGSPGGCPDTGRPAESCS